MTTYVFAIGVFCFCLAVAVLWANPSRGTNQGYTLVALLITVWFAFVYKTIQATSRFAMIEALLWHRANAATAAFVPWGVWLLKESIVSRGATLGELVRRSLRWFSLSLVLATLCFANAFVTLPNDAPEPVRGFPYLVYTMIGLAAYVTLLVRSHQQMQTQSGIRRIEMQFFTLNFGYVGVIVVMLTSIGNLLHIRAAREASITVILASFAITAWAVTVHRVFDARQVFRALGQRILLVGLVVFIGWGLAAALHGLMPNRNTTLIGFTLSICAVFWLEKKTRQLVGLGDEQILNAMRREVIAIARTDASTEQLVEKFEQLLMQRCHAGVARLLFESGDGYSARNIEFARNRAGFSALCESGWLTPESIQRRRATPSRLDLAAFMADHSLGLVLAIPLGSPGPSLLVALGLKPNEWPYTYPEVRRLQNIAELMDNILTRSRLTTQAALKAKTEHLAMMSRGLAHDLKNLLTPVSSFLVHTEGRFPSETVEAEVHAAAQRSVRIMGEYVREARFFADQLQPRYETIRLRPIVESVQELMSARAAARGVKIVLALAGDDSMTADRVLVQRLVANLVANAIDASASGKPVTISAACSNEHVRLQVADAGCGIPPENLSRIFEAYFTTKEFGDDVRGFGLGLTICQKIVALHRGTIVVDSEIGRGTTITVDLPRSQPSLDERARQPDVQTTRDG